MIIDKLIEQNPYKYDFEKKNKFFIPSIKEAFEYHYKSNSYFKKWLDHIGFKGFYNNIENLPFFPSAVFKHIDFNNKNNNNKIIESSGTSAQKKSKISIDSITSKRQIKILSKILNELIGYRKPYFIIDFSPEDNNNKIYSARYAGMSGYLLGASKRIYCLRKNDDKEKLDYQNFRKILSNYINDSKPIVIIGYTYMIYKFIIDSDDNLFPNLPKNSKIIHFGGWKKMYDKKITKKVFNKILSQSFNLRINDIIDIYGFTEQLGTVYPSIGNSGNKVPIYTNVIVRDPDTLKPVKDGEVGLLQFLSPIPNSYPGISLLNDDMGRIIKRNISNKIYELEFEVTGRPDQAEPRGCGDTLPDNYYI